MAKVSSKNHYLSKLDFNFFKETFNHKQLYQNPNSNFFWNSEKNKVDYLENKKCAARYRYLVRYLIQLILERIKINFWLNISKKIDSFRICKSLACCSSSFFLRIKYIAKNKLVKKQSLLGEYRIEQHERFI